MTKDNGGPAFPTDRQHAGMTPGMSLRDYFAGQAIPAVFAAYATSPGKKVDAQNVAGDCYHIADAMLAERSK